MSANGMFGVGVDMLSDMEIIVMTPPAINLAFVVGVSSRRFPLKLGDAQLKSNPDDPSKKTKHEKLFAEIT